MKIKLQQMLHGYENGHNYIRGSIYLSSTKDMDTIANLSDWSEYVNKKDDSSYLSAYPLSESGYYVLARTWYADEMNRPGCVWTHSILIPIAAMRYIWDYRIFDNLFKRPKNADYERYDSIIEYDPLLEDEARHLTSLKNAIGISSIIKNLIVGNRQSMLKVEASSETNRLLCLMIMNVLPSTIMTNRSFCSGTSGLRVIDGNYFDVQFTQIDNPNVKSILELEENIENAYLYASLCVQNEVVSFGKLVRMFEGEISADRKKYEAFCELIALLNTKEDNVEKRKEVYYMMIDLLSDAFPDRNEGTLLKTKFLSSAISLIFITDVEFIEYFSKIRNTDFFSLECIELNFRIEHLVNDKNHYEFINLLDRILSGTYINNIGIDLISKADKYLTDNDINYIINEKWNCYLSLVNVCPEILNRGNWSSLSIKQTNEFLSIFRNDKVSISFGLWDQLLKMLVYENIEADNYITDLLYKKCNNYSELLLDFYNENTQHSINNYLLNPCSSRPKEICKWISGRNFIRKELALYICSVIDPCSSYAKSISASGWVFLLDYREPMPLSFYGFMYVLSFNWKHDMFAMEYLRVSFYPLHKAISEGRVSDLDWNKIMPFTDSLPLWQSWDKCKKMRKMVIKRVKKVGLFDDYLKTFTPDIKLNATLVDMWKD